MRVPLARLAYARSGDKGGDANVGLWVSRAEAASEEQYVARHAWLREVITPEQVRRLLPEAESLAIVAYLQPVSRPEIARIRGVSRRCVGLARPRQRPGHQ